MRDFIFWKLFLIIKNKKIRLFPIFFPFEKFKNKNKKTVSKWKNNF